MLEYIKQDLGLLGVNMNVYTSETKITEEAWIEKALEKLKASGDVYEGVLEKPKGHQVDDWEERPQTLFKSSSYGDDIDRALKKSDGSWTYFAGDVGYHYQKIECKFDKMIDVLGFDHIGYVKRITAAVKALNNNQDYSIKTCQMVNFSENGQPVRMSKRSGTFVTVNDLISKVGKDATRFMMVSRHQDMTVDFDFHKVLEQSKDNPLFYIQYAHARIYSVLRHAIQVFERIVTTDNLNSLNDEAELNLIKHLIQWPRIVAAAVNQLEPHRIANYLYDLASAFHALWNKGKENTQLRFIEPNNAEHTAARINLIRATASIIAEGLNVLGIEAYEEMR
jgi:arginyl-tRNA synthetase